MSAYAPNSAADLLAELDALGIQLEADGERLRFRPREKVGADLAGRMKAHKAGIIAALTASDPAPADETPAGWTPAAWRERLLYLANVCEAVRPDIAEQHRVTAARLREQIPTPHPWPDCPL